MFLKRDDTTVRRDPAPGQPISKVNLPVSLTWHSVPHDLSALNLGQLCRRAGDGARGGRV